ncbi:general secretion pathway protein GspB [Vibrio hippocampi]|uniref:Type II secretion system protein GspB C-terminal domain-containing protein n=1 Tax=Vibrio hippocampi TaxID=654686 RepID=A0ABM8ZJ84_9VIBR|nr:general secretion pathway protein GspB [Vibrio hippocampi]CAH0526887.1 hypothetical protein VHP8226_02263 [Vibrio hippocampi]
MNQRTATTFTLGLISLMVNSHVLADVTSQDKQVYELLAYPNFTSLKVLPKQSANSSTKPVELATESITSDAPLVVNTQSSVPQVSKPEVSQPTTRNDNLNLEQLDLSGLDPEIARKVASAFNNIDAEQSLSESSDYIDLEVNQSRYRGRLPAMNLETHMYASDSQRRWIKINGEELREGDRFNGMILMKIEPQQIVIRFDNDLIRIPALYEWQG